MPLDPAQKKAALRMLTYGLYVVGLRTRSGRLAAFTGTWLSQASFEPPLVIVGVNAGSGAGAAVGDAESMAVSVLEAGQEEIAKAFFKSSEPENGAFGGVPFELFETGAPVIAEAPAYFECTIKEVWQPGDHLLVLGELVNAQVRREAEPLRLHHTPWKYGG